jgi:hypothetical protein
MRNHNDSRTLSVYRAELVEASKTVLKWPPGDDRARAVDLLRRAVNEVLAAEGAIDRGRDIEHYIESVRQLINQALNLKNN